MGFDVEPSTGIPLLEMFTWSPCGLDLWPFNLYLISSPLSPHCTQAANCSTNSRGNITSLSITAVRYSVY